MKSDVASTLYPSECPKCLFMAIESEPGRPYLCIRKVKAIIIYNVGSQEMQHRLCHPEHRSLDMVHRISYALCRQSGVVCRNVQVVFRMCRVARSEKEVLQGFAYDGCAGFLTDECANAISL